jgi:hypothetical protein
MVLSCVQFSRYFLSGNRNSVSKDWKNNPVRFQSLEKKRRPSGLDRMGSAGKRPETLQSGLIFFGSQRWPFFFETALHFLHLNRPGFSLFSDFPFRQLIGFS